jgi:hypothetical protein
MGKANYSATTSLVSITSETCGTNLLKRLNDTISPKSGDNTKQAKNKYTTHKDSFHDDTHTTLCARTPFVSCTIGTRASASAQNQGADARVHTRRRRNIVHGGP